MQNKSIKQKIEQIWLGKCEVPMRPLPSTHLSLSKSVIRAVETQYIVWEHQATLKLLFSYMKKQCPWESNFLN